MIRKIAFFLVMIFVGVAHAETLVRIKGAAGNFEYTLRVDEERKDGGPPYVLRITCARGCAAREIVERLSDAPLGVIQVRDNVPVVITTWIGGTAYWVRAYALTPKGVQKVFEQATLAVPAIMGDETGSPEIVLREPTYPAYEQQGPPQRWTWNGTMFARR